MIRSTHSPVKSRLTSRVTKLLAEQDESLPFACPYCPKRFYSLSGQAQHLSQTACNKREQAALNAVRVTIKRRWVDTLENNTGESSKRVRFEDTDATSVNPEANEAPIPPDLEPEDTTCLPETLPKPPQPPIGKAIFTKVHPDMYIERFPNTLAGTPINDIIAPPLDLHAYIQSTGSLSDRKHFETLEILMTIGLTNKGRDRLLKSEMYKGRTPWKNCKKMLQDLDWLPHGPKWVMYEIEISEKNGGIRTEYLFGCNIIDLVRSLIGDTTFKDDLRYAPILLWATKDRKVRIYGEAWTGNWWWRMQMKLSDPSATIIPLIIATDRTRLSTMCGGQQAYPVYVTIGNLPKSIRRKVSRHATILLGYLPVDDFKDVANLDERARLKNKLTHDAMTILMAPLKQAAKEGVVMACADGRQRRVYPIPAAFEGDWPEQCAMASAEESGCPICEQDYDHRAEYPNNAPHRNPNDTLAALRVYMESKDAGDLKPMGLKPWWPWWAGIPHFNFHTSIMPDLLHQLYQGMIKTHAITWSKKVVGVSMVDKCFKGMPGMVGLRHFTKGISKVSQSQWTGRESKEMAKQLLPIVAGQQGANPNFVALIRSILDFTFRAHQSQMTEEDIEHLQKALNVFHTKKQVLVTVKIYEELEGLNGIKKLHMLTHYAFTIREMGTPDGYNTEAPEHLHIIYAKRGWRASNKVRPMEQMVRFIQRYETIRIHRAYMDRYHGLVDRDRMDGTVVYGEGEESLLEQGNTEHGEHEIDLDIEQGPEPSEDGEDESSSSGDEDEDENARDSAWVTSPANQCIDLDPDWTVAIKPTVSRVSGHCLIQSYGATDLVLRVNDWLEETIAAGLLPRLQFVTADHAFDVWHKVYLHHRPLVFDPDQPPRRDTIRAKPAPPVREGSKRDAPIGTFDTVLFLARPDETGIFLQQTNDKGYRAGRVRAIFSLPSHLLDSYPDPLVYLDLFSPFPKSLAISHGMYTTAHDEYRVFGQSPQGFPFERHDLLSMSKQFFFNHYSNHFIFGVVEHWRRVEAKADQAKVARLREIAEEAARAKAARGKAARARLVQARAELEKGTGNILQ
ncbi:Protein NYNRIN [Rhizoctonia solani]|uniref:Protein NYNRIN n=1 Tax=Rhizoctonia solani TaxID=456999 RepID=A0A0K6FXI4_9AGAM|nr:Protein NYNRIN [Rhizoctonia solani]